ncbi:MAG TPA: hypothetical protein VNG33_22995, partial [Polyangiaceae bacterium]|nr:hypothetical protein [Polyangiaceae bacterium]
NGQLLLQTARATAERGAPFLLLGLSLTYLLGDAVQGELKKLGKSLPVALGARLTWALGAEGLALGLGTYGVAWTLAATLATTLVPIVASIACMLVVAIAGEELAKQTAARLAEAVELESDRLGRFDRATAIWVVAVAASAVFTLSLADGALYGSLAGPSELVAACLFGGLLGTGGPSVVALGALTEKGLSPGAALLGAALSSALGAGVLVTLWRSFGPRVLTAALIWLVCLTCAVGIGINQVAPIPSPLHFPAAVGRVALWLLLGLIAVRAERVGVRRWLAGWFARASAHAAHHDHHHHGHAHDH